VSAREGYLAALAASLDAREDLGLRRRLRLPSGIDLVSNDYLGLADHPHLRERMRVACTELPAGSGGSRLLRGHQPAFDALEQRLAAFCGTESALLFATGYAANVGLLQAIVGRHDLVLSDARNHASLIDGLRLCGAERVVYPHQDLDAVEAVLKRRRAGRAFVVTESVFSMDGDLTPLAALVALAERHGALVIVDEAHATGLFGARGSGRVEELGLTQRVLATMHTGGKALGSAGAWVAGPAALRDTLVNHARTFVFSTAPLPVLGAALHAGLDVVAAEPQRRSDVHRKADLLRAELGAHAAAAPPGSPIVPVAVGANAIAVGLEEALGAQGFDVRAVRPPTVPDGTARLRVTVRQPVADADLLRFARALRALRDDCAA
jgi:8-amino-7-oxononanoate synthase